VNIKVTQEFLSKALKIPNEGNKLFFNSWFNDVGVIRNQLILECTKPDHDFNSTNLQDVPKILHNIIWHTLLPRCGTFDVVTDTDLCIIYHLMTKTKLNLCFVILKYTSDSCLTIKQKVEGKLLPFLRLPKYHLKEKTLSTPS